jgi:hypothetical protein
VSRMIVGRRALFIAAWGVLGGIGSSGQVRVNVDEIRAKALAALETNTRKLSNVLFRSENWSEFSGHQPGFCGLSACPEIHFRTPNLLSHLEIVDHKPVRLLDRWEDQPPIEKSVQQRVIRSGVGFKWPLEDYANELLNGTHPLEFIGMKVDRGRSAFVLIARPPTDSRFPTPLVRCAAALIATVFIDSETFFPVRMDVEVVRPEMCPGEPTFPENRVGTKFRFHCVRVVGQDPCGQPVEIYAVDRMAQDSVLSGIGVNMAPGSLAARPFLLGPGYSSAVTMQANKEFHLFVTGACPPKFDNVDDARATARPVSGEHLAMESRFDLEGSLGPGAGTGGANSVSPAGGIPPTQSSGPPREQAARSAVSPSSGRPARSSPTIQIMRNGKPVSIRPPYCSDFCGHSGNFDLGFPPSILVDTRPFEGTPIGSGGDYFLNETLKHSVLEVSRHILNSLGGENARPSSMLTLLQRELLLKMLAEVFGEKRLSPERIASMALAASSTPAEAATGIMAFHRDYNWNFAKRPSADQAEIARRIWKANFFPTEPAPGSPIRDFDVRQSALARLLANGCVDGDTAVTAYLNYALSGSGILPGPARLEISGTTPGTIHIHLRPDLPTALSIAETLTNRRDTAIAYTERDERETITGTSLFLFDSQSFANYVASYYHGQLCADR